MEDFAMKQINLSRSPTRRLKLSTQNVAKCATDAMISHHVSPTPLIEKRRRAEIKRQLSPVIARLTHVARSLRKLHGVRNKIGCATWCRPSLSCPWFLGYLTTCARGCRICAFPTYHQVTVLCTHMMRRNRASGRGLPARQSSRVPPITPRDEHVSNSHCHWWRPLAIPARGRMRAAAGKFDTTYHISPSQTVAGI